MSGKALSDSERVAIENSVKAVIDDVLSAAERVDMDGIVRHYADVPWASVMNVGYFYPSIKAFESAFRAGFSQMTRQSIKPEETRICVLSPDAAFVAMYGNTNSVGQDGGIGGGHFCLTLVLTSVDGKWRIVHAHQSFVR
jgi:ketosteroid isomerase-like protein